MFMLRVLIGTLLFVSPPKAVEKDDAHVTIQQAKNKLDALPPVKMPDSVIDRFREVKRPETQS